MGLSMGATHGSTDSSSTGASGNTYTSGQSSLQDQLMAAFSKLLPGVASGSMSPNVTNMQTAKADQINQNYSGLGDKMNRFLAARGFGQSGQTGKAAMQTELGRQGALAANASAASGEQLNLNQSILSDSLLGAFNAIGATGNTTGSSSGTSFGVGASAKIPGFG